MDLIDMSNLQKNNSKMLKIRILKKGIAVI